MNDNKTSIIDAIYEEPGPKTKRCIRTVTVIAVVALILLVAFVVKKFYDNGQLDAKYWTLFTKYTTWRFIGKGLVGTIEAAIAAGIITFFTGLILMFARVSKSKILQVLSTAIIEFTRGVPTLLFIYFFFLIAPQLGIQLPAFWKISLPVAISASGVVAEVLRSGVNAVPKGQTEAALSIGMSDRRTFFKIVFPQAIRYVVPALIAEIVIVVKDTTFAYIVNFPDLMQNAKVLITNYDALLSVYLVTAIIYILINYILNKISVAIANRNDKKYMTNHNNQIELST